MLKPLGLVLEEGDGLGDAGVFVSGFVPDGTAAKTGKLMPGDKLVRISGDDVSQASLEDVIERIGAAKSSVRLLVERKVQVPAGLGNTVLAVPIGGPGVGLSRFDIVRVAESPSSWGLRLLVNSAVIGRMESGYETLVSIAAGRGPAKVADCGLL